MTPASSYRWLATHFSLWVSGACSCTGAFLGFSCSTRSLLAPSCILNVIGNQFACWKEGGIAGGSCNGRGFVFGVQEAEVALYAITSREWGSPCSNHVRLPEEFVMVGAMKNTSFLRTGFSFRYFCVWLHILISFLSLLFLLQRDEAARCPAKAWSVVVESCENGGISSSVSCSTPYWVFVF